VPRSRRPSLTGAAVAALLAVAATPLAASAETVPSVPVQDPAAAFAVTIAGQPTGGDVVPHVAVDGPVLAWTSSRSADDVVLLDVTTTAVDLAHDQPVPATGGSVQVPPGSVRGTWTWTLTEGDGTVLASGSWLQVEGADPMYAAPPGSLPVTPAGASSSIEFNRWTLRGLTSGDPQSYHSAYAPWQRTEWVVLDVGRDLPIQRVMLMPFQHAGRPFAAPVDVEVQVSPDPSFATYEVLARRDDIVNPAGLPIWLEQQTESAPIGRYVRVVVPRAGRDRARAPRARPPVRRRLRDPRLVAAADRRHARRREHVDRVQRLLAGRPAHRRRPVVPLALRALAA